MILRLISLIRKEFIQIVRDPRTLVVIIVMPIAMLFLLGYAANTDVKNLPIAVWDQSRTPSNLKSKIISGDVWEVFAEPLQNGLAALHDVNGVLRVGLTGDHIRTITERGVQAEALRNALDAKGVTVREIVPGEPTLEDVFLSLAR